MKIVNCAFHTGHEFRIDNPDVTKRYIKDIEFPYESLAKEVLKERKGVIYSKCPAVTDFFKNTYVFHSPMDLNIDVHVSNDQISVWCDNVDQEFFDIMVDIRFLEEQEKGISPYPLIGVDFLNTFTCNESLKIQSFPAFLHYNDFTSKTALVPGEYDISKWVRPVELVFELKNKIEKIQIKKGDALYYFKFLDDNHVKLQKNSVPWDDVVACNDIRNANKFRPLKDRYASYEKWKKENGKEN